MDNIYKAVQLTIDSPNLALSKTPTHVYIANQYVDTNDTPLITAPFIIQKALENGTGVVDIVSSTIGSIYEVRLLCDAEVLISGYFYMPPMNVNFSELELYTSYPPRTPPVVNEFWQKTENFILEKTNTLLNFVQVFNSLSSMRLSLGYLEELATTKKSNLVSAINEVLNKTKNQFDIVEEDISGINELLGDVKENGWTDVLIETSENFNQRQINDGVESIAQLLSIKKPRDGMRVFVKSYYDGFGVGGGWFYFVSGSTETPIQGLIIAGQGGVWKREAKPFYLVEDFGMHESKDATTNTVAAKIAFANVKNIVAIKKYNINLDSINVTSNTILTGGGSFIGQDPDTLGADARFTMFSLIDVSGVKFTDITIKNGYAGKGINLNNSHDCTFDNVTVDGFTYGIWVGESTALKGSTNIRINNAKIKNTRYWGIYIRCLGVTVDADKTYDIVCTNSYFYNAHGAGFVCSEGNVKNVVLENSFFEDCNVAMHFEETSYYKVSNVTTVNTAKKESHLYSPEYPFNSTSVYQAFANYGEFTNCTFDNRVYCGTREHTKVKGHRYTNCKFKNLVIEGWGDKDVDKDFFSDFIIDGCISEKHILFCQGPAGTDFYIRDFTVKNCLVRMGEEGDLSGVVNISLSTRAINLRVIGNTFLNSTVYISAESSLQFKDNIFYAINNRSLTFDGITPNGVGGATLDYTGNVIHTAYATDKYYVVQIKNFAFARVDNFVMVCNGSPYAFDFQDNYRVEMGSGTYVAYATDKIKTAGASQFVYLYPQS